MTGRRRTHTRMVNKHREQGFDLSIANDKLPDYNALFDRNLRHYFENRNVQSHLYRTGLIDKGGRIIDLEANKAKLSIIEQEFKNAEMEEKRRLREEEEMRRRVQKKRHEALQAARKQEKMAKAKEDRRIRQEIVRVSRGVHGASTLKKKKRRTKKRKTPKGSLNSTSGSDGGHFFMTSLDDDSRGDSRHVAAHGPATSVPSSPELDEY